MSDVVVVDAIGRLCPLPIIDIAKAARDLPAGTEIELLADDPAAAGDVAAWCSMRGHELVSSKPRDDGSTTYRIRLT